MTLQIVIRKGQQELVDVGSYVPGRFAEVTTRLGTIHVFHPQGLLVGSVSVFVPKERTLPSFIQADVARLRERKFQRCSDNAGQQPNPEEWLAQKRREIYQPPRFLFVALHHPLHLVMPFKEKNRDPRQFDLGIVNDIIIHNS